MIAQGTNKLPQQGVFEQTRALLLRVRRHQAVLQICNLLLAPERVEGEVGILEHTCWRREEGIGATRVEIDPYLEEGTIRFEREGAESGPWSSAGKVSRKGARVALLEGCGPSERLGTLSLSPLRSTMSCAVPVGKTRERACGLLR